jgi:hypothetical protein
MITSCLTHFVAYVVPQNVQSLMLTIPPPFYSGH